uniref:ATP synthase complex subunit 8 n=1 Tax=Operophtera brumata TaxID=104452 RepID=A0A0K0M9Q8_OPEBR|nr:ATP synthase F0 subunit 8 [Operophtera brumata]AJW60224.1 ATP synthase F0 subunit 8 [Operophtera brumata]
MPQMMPINWLISFMFFIIIFLMFNIMNYFIMNLNLYNNKNLINKTSFKKNFNWKW